MCGIAGQFNRDLSPVDSRTVKAMGRALLHRGPDDEGFHIRENIGLAHRRLSFLDSQGGRQPMSNEDQSVWVASNAEIYNFTELRRTLELKGYAFRTRTDTEVILRAYEAYGEKCVDSFVGMFAIAIWDERRKQLFLARDPFGIKPLYYSVLGKTVLFSSELKSILRHPSSRKQIDFRALDQLLSGLTVTEPRTIVESVRKLPAGHHLTADSERITITSYWEPCFPKETTQKNDADYVEELRRELKESVALSLRSEFPLGIFLSGGIDSSALAAVAQRHSDQPIKTFAATFSERDFDEGVFSRSVAEHLGTEHHELKISKQTATAAIAKIARLLDEPFADTSILPTYLLCEEARMHVKGVLSGEGGDELFGGSPWHSTVPRPDPNYFSPRQRQIFGSLQKDRLYAAGVGTRESGDEVPIPGGLDPLECGLFADLKTYLPSDLLFKIDRASMMASLEARVPFLNLPFAQAALAVPTDLKIRNGEKKFVLKQMMEGILPDEILRRPKKGFSVPLDIWIWEKGDFRTLVYDTLLDEKARRRGYFNFEYVQSLCREHDRLESLHGYRLWTLFAFELWNQEFIDESR